MCFIWNIRKDSLWKGTYLFTPESRVTPIGQCDVKANWGYVLRKKIGLLVQACNLTTRETDAQKITILETWMGYRVDLKTAWATQ